MIHYSVSLRGNPQKPDNPKKAYGHVQLAGVIDLDRFAQHIASHGSKYDRGDIYAVLVTAGRCMRELVLQGNKVSLGDLGAFYPTIKSGAADSVEAFLPVHIKRLTIGWDKPQNMEDMTAEASFVQVSSRAAQAAALKAEKEGKTNANWDSTTAPDGEGDSAVDPDEGNTSGGNGGSTNPDPNA